MTRRQLLWTGPLLLVLVAAIWPLASGQRTFILRDVFTTHLGLRAFLADSLRRGEVPLVDPLRAGGQVLVGNPNAVPLYPDNLLLLVGSTLWQLNAHFWLHGLVALAAMYALARVSGLAREPALVAGTVYAFSGYLLSQMNLYNAVAGAALAPALAAALLASASAAVSEKRRALALVGFGLVWALELLAGDPLLAVLALVAALALGWSERRRIPWLRAALALGAGTMVAAPQWVELLRQLPTSYRRFWGSSAATQAWGNPEPHALLDLALPFFFGRPDLQQGWGNSYFGGAEPLYYSLAPGVLALALVAVALRRPARGSRAVVALLVLGVLLTFSGGVAVRWLAYGPGGQLFRLAVKFVLFAAVAGSLLAGRGFELTTTRDAADGDTLARATLTRALLAFGALFAALAFLFARPGNPLEGAFRAVMGSGLDDRTFAMFRRGWAVTATLQLLLALLFLALTRLRARWSDLSGGLLLALHAGSQLLLLRPMLATDEARFYRAPPPLLERLPADAVLTHGAVYHLFGAGEFLRADYPDRRVLHLARRAQSEAFFFAGALAGRRYEFARSPEGLDSFLMSSLARATTQMSDAGRLHVLAATGVDRLLLERELAADAGAQAELLERVDAVYPLFVYRPLGALGEAQLLGGVRFAPSVTAAILEIAERRFDPTATALLAGQGETRANPPGRAEIVSSEAERVRLLVDSPAGGALVLRRAWLPHWRATIDRGRVPTVVANVTRLAVEVPAGRHEVELWVERTPFRLALIGSVVGLFALALLARPAAGAGRSSTPG